MKPRQTVKRPYVTERGERQWIICRWDELRQIYVEGVTQYRTKAEAKAALKQERDGAL